MLRTLGVLLTLPLLGCTGPSPDQPRSTPIPYTLDAGGIQLTKQMLRVDFGRTAHSTDRAMTKLTGQPAIRRETCPNGRPKVTYADGTTLYFAENAFKGWSKPRPNRLPQQAGNTCTAY